MIGARDLEIQGFEDQHQWKWQPHPDSRFLVMAVLNGTSELNISVRRNTHNLSPNTTYAAYLILADGDGGAQEQNKTYPVRRDDGWMEVEMGSFYIDDDNDDGEVEARLTKINKHRMRGLLIDGIEFRPKIQFDDLEDELTIEGGDNPAHWQWKACADSRFPEVVELKGICLLEISVRVEIHKLFSYTIYAAYLVYKLAEGCYGLDSVNAVVPYFFRIPSVVHLKQLEQNGRQPVRRADGWMEVEIGIFYKDDIDEEVEAKLTGMDGETWKKGLIIESIEFRPKP